MYLICLFDVVFKRVEGMCKKEGFCGVEGVVKFLF
ncbi:hypothetical protein PEDI_31570 [Persicobacter diffluens]|uniref:Uncharacterized protein n=1 Tax=Persicobacter diffluens TaxID=981 RepID=A0AAN5AK95_9BACT|nr:hypothetical protein PEDI_31570 [Persicobacter diffluens]